METVSSALADDESIEIEEVAAGETGKAVGIDEGFFRIFIRSMRSTNSRMMI